MKQVRIFKKYQTIELENAINYYIQDFNITKIIDIKINMAIDEDLNAVYLATIIYEDDSMN
ncbi:sporulation protein Cse60 [Enterococcus cecorum]|uniref:sporulation protein Cse60 n=1 Tax=Enterococcus cecorum TaxID=44008 RepID=UPI00195819D9|nr:sporulation protein Cse60 [Enterococcus cecorum]MBM6936108.1 sporulation protein Cse60 [Enterococcus cecorum]